MSPIPSTTSKTVNGVTFDKVLPLIHFTPNVVNGKLSVSALVRCTRCAVASDGGILALPGYEDKGFPADALAKLRSSNPDVDAHFTALETALSNLVPALGC